MNHPDEYPADTGSHTEADAGRYGNAGRSTYAEARAEAWDELDPEERAEQRAYERHSR